MPILNKIKTTASTEPTFQRGGFRPDKDAAKHVPGLAEANPETYGKLTEKLVELHAAQTAAIGDMRAAEKVLAAHEGPTLRAGVADLLGDDSGKSRAAKAASVRDARQRVADIEAAITIVQQRLRDAKPAALRAVVAKVRPEWDRRAKKLAEALKAAQDAHIALHELRQALEAEDVDASHMGAWPYFMGEAKNGRIAQYLKEAGYAV